MTYSRMNLLEEIGNDTIHARTEEKKLYFSIIVFTVQFYFNRHNSQFNCWIESKFYKKSPNII
jgi:hypothetical protein